MKKNNKEKGSITLFVLIGIIFILIILGVIYFSRQNKSMAQEKEIRQTEKLGDLQYKIKPLNEYVK